MKGNLNQKLSKIKNNLLFLERVSVYSCLTLFVFLIFDFIILLVNIIKKVFFEFSIYSLLSENLFFILLTIGLLILNYLIYVIQINLEKNLYI